VIFIVFSIVLIFIFLFVSAFFSASETAITAASRPKLHHLTKEGDEKAKIIKSLQENLGLVISTFLICNTLFNTWAISLTSALLVSIFGAEGVLYASLLMSVCIVVFAEVSPKVLAVQNPERFLLSAARFLKFVYRFCRPLTRAINFIIRASLEAFGVKVRSDVESYTPVEELKGAIDLHQGPEKETADERAMLKSILDLRSVHVSEIMVHRKNVTMVNAELPLKEIIKHVSLSPFTRIPLWRGDQDNIIGVVNAKALLRAVHTENMEEIRIETIATKPWFIPESTDLLDQLQSFRDRREHFALVVDEYGTFMGVVTLEDILEEIVGDISDEHDITVKGVRPQSDGSFIVDGNVTIRDLNRQFDWSLPDAQASTLAGFVLYEMKIIPEVNQVFLFKGFRLEILRRHRNQITLIRVMPPQLSEDA
jgi:Mg2+/Co2+ transporter CorB